jgi:metal-responsive CopG/Arc/MetJ family transcriptional regulator
MYYISMVGTTKADRTEKLGITLPISLLQEIDNKRGDIPRSKYIRRAVESYLKAKGSRVKSGNC